MRPDFSDDVYKKFYQGWGRTEANADWQATGEKKWRESQQASDPVFQAQERSRQQAQQSQQLLADQTAKNKEFLGRYTTGLGAATTALEQELGLPQLREGAQAAGSAARGVAETVRSVAPTEQTVAKQVGISAPRLQQRIAAKTAELAPTLSAAQRGLEEANAAQQFAEGQFTTRMGTAMKPFEIEAGMLGEEVKSQFDLFKTNLTADLNRELEMLKEKGINDRATLDRAIKLAEAEKASRDGTFTDLGDRIALIDPITGREISSFSKGMAPALKTIDKSGW